MDTDCSYQFPVALQWDLGPEKLKELKNKLLVYFQSKSKSNGGECAIKDPDCTQGFVLIHFSKETVRDAVLKKESHNVNLSGGKRLKLVVSLPKVKVPTSNQKPPAECAEPCDHQVPVGPASLDVNPVAASTAGLSSMNVDSETPPSVALIENISDTCTMEMLILLVENISGKYVSTDFTLEMIPEIKSGVVTFSCNVDIPNFIRAFHENRRVKQMKLRAKPLEETRSIRAENLPPNTSDDHLIIYFECPRFGGGAVNEVELIPEEDAAIITFADKQVTRKVLEKQHVFGKKPILVYPYYESLGVTLYGENGPCITLPKPLEFPVSPYILEFILGHPQIKDNVEKEMADNCELTWPDPKCSNPTIKISIPSSISSHLRTMVKIVRTWSDQASTEFSLIISKFKAAEYNVNPSVWEAIKEEVSSSKYEGVLVKPDLAKQKVFLAGLSKDITKLEQTFRDLVENTSRRIDRINQSMEVCESLAPALYEIMFNSGHINNIQSQSPDLRMKYDVSNRNLNLYGVKEEILSAQCEILQITRQLKFKSIPLDPHIINFLGLTDNDELSCLLLTRYSINAMFNTEDTSVKLTGFSMKDLSEAEEQMRRELACKQFTVEDKMIIKGPEWKSLHTHLCKLFNSEKCTIMIEALPRGAENQVVIAGLASSVGNAAEQVNDFLERNTPIQKEIQVKSVAVIQFIREEKQDTLNEIKKKNVSVTLKRKSIALRGCRLYVHEAVSLIERVLPSLHTEVLRVNKPGAKKFFIEKEEIFITTARSKYKCIIYLQKEGEEDFTDIDMNVNEVPKWQIALPCGITIAVYKDDLTRHQVDVIVNAANEDLKHIGGLALALLRAAGPKLQTDCDQIVKRSGKLLAGEAKISDGGNLPCKQVIHAVGPRWDPSSQVKCERQLRKAITNSLELATENGHTSIAIPAVSSGIFGFPMERCIKNITETISQFSEDYQGTSSIKRIHIVDMDDRIISTFIKLLKVEFEDKNVHVSPKSNVKEEEKWRPNSKPEGIREPPCQMIYVNGVAIKLIKGNLQDATTDVIVNSIGKDLDLDSGGASKAILCKAGKKLQYLLNEECKGKQVQEGSVFATNGCDLSCQMVLHVITPRWNQGNSSGEKMLREIIHICLSSTEKKQMTSITFPAIGTGALSFPKNLVAALMFEEVEKFTGSKNVQYLQEVNFVLHPSDMDTNMAFFGVLKTRMGTNGPQVNPPTKPVSSKSSGAEVFGLVATPTLGIHEMKIGSVTYQVKTGDITKETTDVIINSSNGDFTLRTGVSKAILEAAGQSVADECAKLGSMPHRGFIITDKGNLLCKKILHVYCLSSPSEIKSCVLDVLQECERIRVTSVAFPAIGSGGGSVRPMDVADAMQEAVIAFISSKSPQCLQMVKVVIFQEKMLQDFYKCMKNKEGTIVPKQTSIFGKISSFFGSLFSNSGETEEPSVIVLKENIEPAIFFLCGEASDQVKAAKLWLEKLIQQEQSENIITNDWILEFDEQEQQKLCELQKRSQVSISFESQRSTIIVSGLTRDVFTISKEIQDMIKKISDKKTREREADLCSNLVEWRYHNGNSYVPFDKMSNLDLETAKREGRQSLGITVGRVHYTVNMELNSASDPQGKTMKIDRAPKSGESMELPPHWEDMKNEHVKVVPLNSGSPEYNDVQSQFVKSCAMKIIKIERIQNKHLWLNYQIKKQSIDAKNNSTNNDMQLFHGSDPNTIKNVNQNGFNRSYAGRNAACYGNGTYFAVDALYSAHDTYSKPDQKGQKHMYLARVLTGISCVGQRGMVAPPAKNASNPTDLYDSVTDNKSNPAMFVIFNDIQAYPEYLITFTK